MAAKHGKDHLDKAMRYLLDSDVISAPIPFDSLASSILVTSHPSFYLLLSIQKAHALLPSPLDLQLQALPIPTLNQPAVSLYPLPNPPTPTPNSILPPTGLLPFTSIAHPAYGLPIAPSFPFQSGTYAWEIPFPIIGRAALAPFLPLPCPHLLARGPGPAEVKNPGIPTRAGVVC